MAALVLEIWLVLFCAFLAGSLAGFGWRRLWRKPVLAAVAVAAEPATAAAPLAVVRACASGPVRRPEMPRALAAPRAGAADDLRRISGIGPRMERALHDLGYFHHEQIARWNGEQMEAVSLRLGFPGRVAREQWVAQARVLAVADDPEIRHLPHTAAARPRSRAWRRKAAG